MPFDDLQSAIATVRPGGWAVAVSGGADSVALLRLLAQRRDVQIHVVHLDHQLRGPESLSDAAFTRSLADQLGLRCTIATAEQVSGPGADLPRNLEARGRALRMRLFQTVVMSSNLSGVVLAHHADDQAETVLMRLLRGSSIWTMRGMRPTHHAGGLCVLRPLLGHRRLRLREFLRSIDQPWRYDDSNESMAFTRNRVRKLLAMHPPLFDSCINLSSAAGALRDWVERVARPLTDAFHVSALAGQPILAARWMAVRWLIAQGSPPEECSLSTADGLIEMCRDAASPSKRHFPGGVEVRRKAKRITAMAAPPAESQPP